MPEWNEDVKHFMTFWFAGLMDGLDALDEPARKTVLRACGKACARSYTGALFQEAWNNSAGIAGFLAALSGYFPEAAYVMETPDRVRVRYARCACDLVQHGLVTAPMLCDCSAQNLESNFAGALGRPVAVTLVTSLLRGGDHCEFLVALEGRD